MEENENMTNSSQGESNSNEIMGLTQKFSAEPYSRDILTAVKTGEINPLDAMIVVKRFEKVAKLCLEDLQFKKMATDEADKHLSGNQKSFLLHSAQVCRGATYTKYDFSESNHPILNQLYEIRTKVEESIKRYEEELKLLLNQDSETELDLGVPSGQKEIVVDRMPFLSWEKNEDQVTVKAPKKLQTIGLKFMKI